MNQTMLAISCEATQQHFNAVVKGRVDAGKKLASRISANIGGAMDVWMLEAHREERKRIIDNYLAAFRKVRDGGQR